MASYLHIPQAGFKIATSLGNSNRKTTLTSRDRELSGVGVCLSHKLGGGGGGVSIPPSLLLFVITELENRA